MQLPLGIKLWVEIAQKQAGMSTLPFISYRIKSNYIQSKQILVQLIIRSISHLKHWMQNLLKLCAAHAHHGASEGFFKI